MKAFLQYVTLVGIPILSILIFVRIGENTLTAPASIGGNWNLEPIVETENEGTECPGLVFDDEPILSISQSGVYLEVTFNDRDNTSLSGMLLDLTDLTFFAQKSSRLASFILDARIDRQLEPDRLEGMLVISLCEEPFPLLGTRQPELAQTSGGD